MSHPLQKRIRSLGRLARATSAIHGLGWVCLIVLGSAILLALVDYGMYVAIRLDDAGLRFVFSSLVVFALVACAWIFLRPAIRHRFSDVEVAQRIERRFPELCDKLSSSIDFLSQEVDDKCAGSAALRRAVVADTEGFVDQLKSSHIIRFRPTICVALVALLLFAVTSGLVYGSQTARRAVWRLVTPWADVQWPKRNQLAFENAPLRMAVGDDLEVVVVDENGHMPDEVEFQYRAIGDGRPQRKPMKMVNDRMVVRVENVTQSIEFRATGGDDDGMLWRPLEVVEAPAIAEMKVHLIPPGYTGWPKVESGGHIRAIRGTHVEIFGAATKPLKRVELIQTCDEGTKSRQARLGEDGTSFVFATSDESPWLVDQDCEYWLELADEHDLIGGRNQRWRIQPVLDQPPTIQLEHPASNIFVTPDAAIPLDAIIKDDIEVQSVELRFLMSSKSDRGEQTIELFRGPDRPPLSEPIGAGQSERGVTRTQQHQWQLATLGPLEMGQTIDYHIDASDYLPQTGIGPRRQLTIISSDELEDRIGQRQSLILGQLAEVLRVQRDARSQTTGLEIRLNESGIFEKRDIDQLQSTELSQREVSRMLFLGDNAVTKQIKAVIDDMEINKIDGPDIFIRMTKLFLEIARIKTDHLEKVDAELVASLKIARDKLHQIETTEVANPAEAFSEVRNPLTNAGLQQDKAIESLEKLLGEYDEWDNFRRFARDVRRIHRQQDEITQETDDLRRKLIGKSTTELGSQEKADLKILAQRQLELARRFDAVRSGMEQMRDKLAASDPLVATTLDDAVDASLRQAIGGQMRESGRGIEKNQLGQATELQKDVTEGLEELMDVLANRREQELERLVDKLNDAAAELEGLREQQAAIREGLEAAAANSDQQQRERELQQLTKQQQQLAEETERLSRRLERLRAERAAQAAQQAGGSMSKSGEAAGQGREAPALEDAKQAEKQLEDAQQQLKNAINEAKMELYQEKLAKLKQRVEGLVAREQNVVAETIRLNDLKVANNGWTEAQQQSVRDLSRQQRGLSTDTGILAERVEEAEAFALALRGAVREMLRAARQLDQLDTGADTQRAEQVALARLQQLVQALTNDNDQPPPDEQGSEGNQDDMPPPEAIQLLAQLKLLKLMQEEISRRTDEIEEARLRRGGTLTVEQEREVEDLSVEQGKLADLIFNLSKPIQPNPEDDPDELPDVRQEPKLDDELEKALRNDLDLDNLDLNKKDVDE